MGIFLKIRNKIEQYGWKYTLMFLVPRKINCFVNVPLQIMATRVFKYFKLRDIIIIESHNDFDSNGGALYDWLIKNGYNMKYKIVWLLWNKKPSNLPYNVTGVLINRISIKKYYYLSTAKFILTCHLIVGDLRKGQKSMYMTHGAMSLKKTAGAIQLPSNVDYCLIPSHEMEPYSRKVISIKEETKLITLGYPVHDILYSQESGDLRKITSHTYNKTILWMPTLRHSKDGRIDFDEEEALGIPLITNEAQYLELNAFLKKKNMLLIIKIHPMQDMSTIHVKSLDHILVLTGIDIKRLAIDNYRLMKDADGLISDYSSAAFDYLHCNRPIAYVLNDAKQFKMGFIVDDFNELIAGHEIYNIEDMYSFLNDVFENKDPYKEQRNNLLQRVFTYRDGNSAKRVVDFIGL